MDWFGAGVFLLTMAGVALHGGCAWQRCGNPHPTPALEKVYMYTIYERLWHWLQTSAILLLDLHRADHPQAGHLRHLPVQIRGAGAQHPGRGAGDQRDAGGVHHIVSGEIRQYLPGRWASSTRPSPRPSSIWAASSRGTSIPLTRIRATS
ncbi:MAG: hypothetical protein R2838_08925 [Caldilineaceae bacterium]